MDIFLIDGVGNFIEGERGSLISFELSTLLPFEVKRFFTVNTPKKSVTRGEHGHIECWQALACLFGKFQVRSISDNRNSLSWELRPGIDLLCVPPGNIISFMNIEPFSILGVFCSHPYTSSDYFTLPD